jgi:stress-induced morphogen
MDIKEIETRVLSTFENSSVAVFDMTGIGQSFEIRLQAPELEEKTRVERHQCVMALFDKELKTGDIHALSIKYLK